MALHTLSVLARPDFPQLTSSALDYFVGRILAKPTLGMCCYESPESYPGACDGQPCLKAATVHDLASEQEFCARHFGSEGVSRG